MPKLIPCPHCESHLRVEERSCPHCGGALDSRARARTKVGRGAALAMGLALTGCPASPDYGVPDTGGTDDTGMPTGTDGGDDSMDGAEPEYGSANLGPL